MNNSTAEWYHITHEDFPFQTWTRILVLIEKKRKQDGFKYVKIQLYAMCQRDDKVENNHQGNLYLTQMTYIVTLGTIFYTGDLYLTEETSIL